MARLLRTSFLNHWREEQDDLAFVKLDRQLALFWPTVLTVSFAAIMLVAWLFAGSIPVTVKASGVVVALGGVREITTAVEAIVVERPVHEGPLAAGDTLYKLSLPINASSYADARSRYLVELGLLEAQQYATIEKHLHQQQQASDALRSVEENLIRLETIVSSLQQAIAEHEVVQKTMLSSQEKATREVRDLLDAMQEGTQKLRKKGLTSQSNYIQFKQSRTEAIQSFARLSTEMAKAKVDQHQLERELSDIQQRFAQEQGEKKKLLDQLKEIDSQKKIKLIELDVSAHTSRNQLLSEERKLWLGENIFSPYDGDIVALKKNLGELTKRGEAVALINIFPQTPKKLLIISPRAYQGSLLLASKDRTVLMQYQRDNELFKRQLYQSLMQLMPKGNFELTVKQEKIVISATNETLSALNTLELTQVSLLDQSNVPVFAELVDIGDDWQVDELSAVVLLRQGDSKKVNIGDRVLIKPEFEKTLIGTQVIASVDKVSPYVATPLQAQALIGSSEIAQTLAEGKQRITAILRFKRNKQGELQLNGDSLSQPLSSGTMITSYIEIEKASPIEILLPFYADIAK